MRELPCESHDSPHRRSRRRPEFQRRTTDDQLQFGAQSRQSGRARSQLDLAQAKKPARPGRGRAVQPHGSLARRRAEVGIHRASRLTERFWSGSAKLHRRPRRRPETKSTRATVMHLATSQAQASDGDLTTIWHTEFVGAIARLPARVGRRLGGATPRRGSSSTFPARTLAQRSCQRFRDPSLR